jgi:hypothetical protein
MVTNGGAQADQAFAVFFFLGKIATQSLFSNMSFMI